MSALRDGKDFGWNKPKVESNRNEAASKGQTGRWPQNSQAQERPQVPDNHLKGFHGEDKAACKRSLAGQWKGP